MIRDSKLVSKRQTGRCGSAYGPSGLAADTGYGDAANLAWLAHERGI